MKSHSQKINRHFLELFPVRPHSKLLLLLEFCYLNETSEWKSERTQVEKYYYIIF